MDGDGELNGPQSSAQPKADCSQMLSIARALQHPYSKPSAMSLLALDLPSFKRYRKIGEGGTAVFWVLEEGTDGKTVGGNLPLRLGMKETLRPVEVHDIKGELNLTDKQHTAKELLSLAPCWDEAQQKYVCHVEVQAEVFHSALSSMLFSCRLHPNFVEQFISGASSAENATERPLVMIQELLGTPDSAYLLNSLEYLPEVLHCMGMDIVECSALLDKLLDWRNSALYPETFPREGLSMDRYELELTTQGSKLLSQSCTEIAVMVLHAIASMQSAFGLQSNDLKPSNILVKVLSQDEPYYDGLQAADYIAYEWQSPATGHLRCLHLPNRGFLAKIADMGMAVAYRVPYVREDGKHSTTSVGFYAYVEGRFDSLRRRSIIGRAAMENYPTSATLSRLKQCAKDLGYEDSEASRTATRRISSLRTAGQMAREAQHTLFAKDMEEYKLYLQNRKYFGIHEEFKCGYDVQFFVCTLARKIQFWLGETADHPLLTLRERLCYEPNQMRPTYGKVSDHGPLVALDKLYDLVAGEYPPGDENSVTHYVRVPTAVPL